MASLDKYIAKSVVKVLEHNTREFDRPAKNKEIDHSRSHLNYSLTPPDRGVTAADAKEYYDQRIQEVYCYGRSDLKTLCQWVITAPKDLKPEDEKSFFKETYNYLNSLYSERNCIQAVVHYDEGVKNKEGIVIEGRPHLHYTFIPVVENKKYMKPNKKGNITESAHYKEKVCCNELINKYHLTNFHPRFSEWLKSKNIQCTVHSGITGGMNRTVAELKLKTKERELEKEQTRNHELTKEINALNEKIASMKRDRERSWGDSPGWGSSPGWENEKSWEIEY